MMRFYFPLAVASLFVAVIIWAYVKGTADANEKRELENARDYIEQTEEIRDATDALPDDDAAVLERLLRYAQ